MPNMPRMPFGDQNVRIEYDLWNHRGLMRLTVTNTADREIYPNWDNTGYFLGGTLNRYDSREDLPGVLRPGESVQLGEYALWTKPIIPDLDEQPVQTLTLATKARDVHIIDYTPSNSPKTFGHLFTYCVHQDCHDLMMHEHQFYVSRVKQLSEKDYNHFITMIEAGYDPPIELVYTDQFYVYKHLPGERGAKAAAGFALALDILLIIADVAAIANDVSNATSNDNATEGWHSRSSASPRYNQGRSRLVSE